MEANVLLSKIVASPTDLTWSQAYSTLNLYVVLSIKQETPQESIVTSGKELLERVQREYFSLDEKDLKNIKQSVENASSELLDKVSVVLTTINDNIAYIVIANGGQVILKREGKLGTIAAGEEGKIVAFSGKLSPGDILILETQDFTKKVGTEKLSETLDALSVSEIAENLTPQVHEDSVGTEAAIVLQYKSIETIPETGAKVVSSETENVESSIQEKESQAFMPPLFLTNLKNKLNISKLLSLLSFGNFKKLGKKKLIVIAIVLLIILLLGSILVERQRQETREREEILAEIINPAKREFEEAEALISLNRGLALEEFESIKKMLDEKRQKLNVGSDERKKLDEFIGKVEGKIGELAGGAALVNQKVIYENVSFVIFREGALIVSDKNGKINLLSTTFESQKEIDSKNNGVIAVTANETAVFILGDNGLTRTTKSGATSTIIEDLEETMAVDVFGANLYGLNVKDKTIDKYSGSSYGRSDYFKEEVTLKDPKSMSIDGSIWIIDAGSVRKFTRGLENSFTVSGLAGKLSNDSQVVTDIDYSNIYILDKNAGKIISITKAGQVENQYAWGRLAAASSFAVDEKGKKIYAAIGNKLYSFDL